MALQIVERPVYAPKKLDIACGQNKGDGFTGIDLSGDADIVHDLFTFPWPIKSSSVSEIRCSHFVEHIPHSRPEWGSVDGWFLFWDEVYRITKKGAKISVIHPYVKSDRAFWDPTHTRYIHEMTWYYLDPEWRKSNGLDHYPTVSDFEVVVISGNGLADDLVNRNQEHQNFARAHYWNAIPDLMVELKRR